MTKEKFVELALKAVDGGYWKDDVYEHALFEIMLLLDAAAEMHIKDHPYTAHTYRESSSMLFKELDKVGFYDDIKGELTI